VHEVQTYPKRRELHLCLPRRQRDWVRCKRSKAEHCSNGSSAPLPGQHGLPLVCNTWHVTCGLPTLQ